MNCKIIEGLLIDYVGGKLGFRERELVEAHARSCASCAERIDGFAGVFSMLDSWEDMEVSPTFNQRLERRIEREESAPAWRISFLRLPVLTPAFTMALMAVIAIGTLLITYTPGLPQSAVNLRPAQIVASADPGSDDLNLYRNLPVAEDLDAVGNFEVLRETSAPADGSLHLH